MNHWWYYFTDPILYAPTIGSMLICLSSALVGVLVFLRKQSLLGETLSHALFPGVMLSVLMTSLFPEPAADLLLIPLTLGGAFATALLGYWTLNFIQRHLRVSPDAALCLVLSSFFGFGITLASFLQFEQPALYSQALSYLYGQVATLTDWHVTLFALLALVIVSLILVFYKELKVVIFDATYAASLGISIRLIDSTIIALLVMAIVIGMRAVGVVLMTAMLIAPAAAARQFSHRLGTIFLLAAFFGLLSGFFGNFLSVELGDKLADQFPGLQLSLPTGPMVVIVAASICLLALLLSPERGLFVRMVRMIRFRYRCLCENLLKFFWRSGPDKNLSVQEVAVFHHIRPFFLYFVLWQLWRNGWLKRTGSHRWQLTEDGKKRSARIVRLHRLWELYLVDTLGIGVERVHRSAEEIEHVLTKELEQQLTRLLHDPKEDPHHQPIPHS